MSIQRMGPGGQPSDPGGIDRLAGKSPDQASNAAATPDSSSTQSISPQITGNSGNSNPAVLDTTSGLRQYLTAAQSFPSVREARVNALRAAIAQGTYSVPIDTLAKRLLGHGGS